MADPLDLTRIDPLPGRSPRDGVDPLLRPADRRQKRRQAKHDAHPATDEEDDEDRQVGTKLDIRV